MKLAKVAKIDSNGIKFDNDIILYSDHDTSCCESHYLDLEHLELSDFDGLEFNLTNEDFFKRIDDYGIELIPIHGHSIKIPGYAYNNGYYSSQLDLILHNTKLNSKIVYDISECQKWED